MTESWRREREIKIWSLRERERVRSKYGSRFTLAFLTAAKVFKGTIINGTPVETSWIGKLLSIPITSPVDFISGPKSTSTSGNLEKGNTASFTEKIRLLKVLLHVNDHCLMFSRRRYLFWWRWRTLGSQKEWNLLFGRNNVIWYKKVWPGIPFCLHFDQILPALDRRLNGKFENN